MLPPDDFALLSLCLATRPAVTPQTLWQAWSFAPAVVGPLVLMLAAYLGVLVRGHGQSGRGSAAGPACFLTGWTLVALALVSPLCRMAAALAWAHMVQHVILVALAPPLLVIGALLALPAHRRLPRCGPLAAGALYAVAIWGAHAPVVYQGALDGATAHVLLVFGLLAVSALFWYAAIGGAVRPDAGAAAPGAAVIAILCALIQTGVLGALLTFAPSPWYPVFADRTAAWGLTPLEDQQLAGLIMWVPMGAIYLAAGLAAATAVVFGRSRTGAA
ncbi:cytochrome c oxidase assembly protein [Azospirillum halopraeferens]|uniref:cytochrome c oxidase assembly protein n=1 Tax=Azospirillum halopraeferens TaxID=34010 RepID=UPI0003FC12C8|nr:cytochrome c oxidase assembly protein [Azospirillum halopraeferens]